MLMSVVMCAIFQDRCHKASERPSGRGCLVCCAAAILARHPVRVALNERAALSDPPSRAPLPG